MDGEGTALAREALNGIKMFWHSDESEVEITRLGGLTNLVFRVEPDQVTMKNIRRNGPGDYAGDDILLNASATLTLRDDGNLDVRIKTFPFVTKFRMIRVALDDPALLDAELSD